MVRAEGTLDDRQRALVEGHRLAIAPLLPVQRAETRQRAGHLGIAGSKRLLVDLERAAVERLGLGVARTRLIDGAEIDH